MSKFYYRYDNRNGNDWYAPEEWHGPPGVSGSLDTITRRLEVCMCQSLEGDDTRCGCNTSHFLHRMKNPIVIHLYGIHWAAECAVEELYRRVEDSEGPYGACHARHEWDEVANANGQLRAANREQLEALNKANRELFSQQERIVSATLILNLVKDKIGHSENCDVYLGRADLPCSCNFGLLNKKIKEFLDRVLK